jgi:hypothetical protein
MILYMSTSHNNFLCNLLSRCEITGKDKNVLYSGSMCPLDSADVTTEGRTSMLARVCNAMAICYIYPTSY